MADQQAYNIQLPNGQVVAIQASSPEEAAQHARSIPAREQGQAAGKESGVMPFINNVVRQTAQGAAFGGADEAAAGLDALTHGALGRGSSAPDLSGRYSENLAKERGQDEGFKEAHPYVTMAANIVGNILGAGALGRTGLPIIPKTGPGLIGNMAKMGTSGAALGGLQGFNEGEGGFQNRANNAIMPAIGGAVGGMMAPPLALGAGLAMETGPGRTVSNWMGRNLPAGLGGASPATMASEGGDMAAEDAARERLATALQRSRMAPEEVQSGMDKLGSQGMLADASDPMMRLTRGASTLEGETRGLAEDVLRKRDLGAGQRLVSAFEGNEPPPSAYELMGQGKGFDAYREATGQQAYGEMADQGLNQSDALRRLYSNPNVESAIDQVLKKNQELRAGTNLPPVSPVEVMHQVKQQIQGLGQTETGRGAPWQQTARDLAGAYTGELKAANPALAAADKSYQAAASLPEFYQMGHGLLGRGGSEAAIESSPAALADRLPDADPLQQLAARAGSTNAAREASLEGIRGARGLSQRINESLPVQMKLNELYGPEHAGQIVNQADAERIFANTSNKLLTGSQTTDKAAEAGLPIPKIGLNSHGEGFARLMEYPKALVERLENRANEPVRDAIGRIMLNPNSEVNRRNLMLAAELMKRRAAPNDLGVGLAGGLGASALRSQ